MIRIAAHVVFGFVLACLLSLIPDGWPMVQQIVFVAIFGFLLAVFADWAQARWYQHVRPEEPNSFKWLHVGYTCIGLPVGIATSIFFPVFSMWLGFILLGLFCVYGIYRVANNQPI